MKISFNKHWNENTIRNLVDNNPYLEFGNHEDLRALCVNEEDMESDTRDWGELTFIVPTRWLRNFCEKKFLVGDLDLFLQEEYTSDESEIIFAEALNDQQIVMVDFC